MWWCLNLFVPVDTINLWWFSLAKCSAKFTDLLRHHHAMISTSFLLSLSFYCPFTFYCWCYCHITALSCCHFVCKSILIYRDLIKRVQIHLFLVHITFHILRVINCCTFNSARRFLLCGFIIFMLSWGMRVKMIVDDASRTFLRVQNQINCLIYSIALEGIFS